CVPRQALTSAPRPVRPRGHGPAPARAGARRGAGGAVAAGPRTGRHRPRPPRRGRAAAHGGRGRAARPRRRAAAALRTRPCPGCTRVPDHCRAGGGGRDRQRARRGGARLSAARRARGVSELTLAAYAAATGRHVVREPADAHYRAFVRRFDARAYGERLRALGVAWVERSSPRFPHGVAAIFDPPAVLFVRGDGDRAPLDAPAVAIVGARACSPYGAEVARTLGRELGRAGLVVISGLARGVDAEAHRGVLDGGGRTVAVLGCGIDRDYPASHAELACRIRATGLVVSEYGPGVEPAPWRFPARNRIVAGLAAATVVVEARERSGALITADLALEEGREGFAVPGEITSALSAGTNRLRALVATPLLE